MDLYNTLGRRRERFVPRDPGRVGMYVCGPTVQAAPHLGHGRAAVVFDVIRRYLESAGFDVTYVQNITDIDDKIIAAAAERGVSTEEVASAAAEQFAEGYRRLGVRKPTHTPRATEHIDDMIEIVGRLVERGHAYASGGDVYFSVRSYAGYGKLSGHSLDALEAGARVEPGEHKQDPADFALWKAAKPGEPSWDSPWGPGRPGWHIECSAMSHRFLDFGFDIHAGGADLIFPHHENEIAQSEGAEDAEPFARYWLHNGLVNLSGEKMAKSTGNVIGLLEALDRWNPLAVRLFYLRTHYRKPVDFSEEALADAEASLERLWAFRRRVGEPPLIEPDPIVMGRFAAAMEDDFDVAGALGVLFETVREGNRSLDAGDPVDSIVAAYDRITGVLGLREPRPGLDDLAEELAALGAEFGLSAKDADGMVAALLERRTQARAAREWDLTDAIRDRLSALGLVIEDTADGARWHRR